MHFDHMGNAREIGFVLSKLGEALESMDSGQSSEESQRDKMFAEQARRARERDAVMALGYGPIPNGPTARQALF